jgi:predicted DCC family thiol-disulfide oxidoreductase YuxK
LRDLRTGELPLGLSREACAARIHLWEPGGKVWAGFDALKRVSALVPSLWWAAPILHLPGAGLVMAPAYDLLARLRFRLSEIVAGRQ